MLQMFIIDCVISACLNIVSIIWFSLRMFYSENKMHQLLAITFGVCLLALNVKTCIAIVKVYSFFKLKAENRSINKTLLSKLQISSNNYNTNAIPTTLLVKNEETIQGKNKSKIQMIFKQNNSEKKIQLTTMIQERYIYDMCEWSPKIEIEERIYSDAQEMNVLKPTKQLLLAQPEKFQMEEKIYRNAQKNYDVPKNLSKTYKLKVYDDICESDEQSIYEELPSHEIEEEEIYETLATPEIETICSEGQQHYVNKVTSTVKPPKISQEINGSKTDIIQTGTVDSTIYLSKLCSNKQHALVKNELEKILNKNCYKRS